MDHNQQVASRSGIASSLLDLSLIPCNSENEIKTSISYLLRALEILRTKKDFEVIVKTLIQLSKRHTQLSDYSRARSYSEEAISIAKEVNNTLLISIASVSLARVLQKLNKWQEILDLLDLISKDSPVLRISDHLEIQELYSISFENIGQLKRSIESLRNYAEIQNKSMQEEKAALVIHQQRVDSEIHKLKSKQLEEKMKLNESDLSNKTLQLVQQTNMLLSLRKDLDSIVRKADTAEKAVRSIREKLKEIPEHLLNWEKFSEEFHKVHPDFDVNLKKKYPLLSKTEIKVCCLLRIGMNTREISTLLFLSERTVEIHRQHIRKKLAIPKKTEMHVTIAEI